jgi:hypothetical protein
LGASKHDKGTKKSTATIEEHQNQCFFDTHTHVQISMHSVSRNPEFAICSAKKLEGEINRRLDEMTGGSTTNKDVAIIL